ncbi:MAG TPA: YchE family NAAT transporter [Methylophilaceae bacterium]|nr:YchE family NAAT transporter [Methylophilaceae bacterium]
MIDWAYLFKIGLALFAIVNPIGTVPIFISATQGWPAEDRDQTARTTTITVFLVLVSSIFFGERILDFFGIGIPSFQVGGGILLMLIAISMLQGRASHVRQTPEEAQEVTDREAIAVVPLSIPLLAGPGAISSMIIAAQQSGSFWGHVTLIMPVIVVCLLIWSTLRLSVNIAHRLGTIGINIVTRLMGLVLAAMAVEFIAHGIQGLFPGIAS